MKSAALLITALTAAAAAPAHDNSARDIQHNYVTPHTMPRFPKCAIPCMREAMFAAGCSYGDVNCGCKNQRTVVNVGKPCVLRKCSLSDALMAKREAKIACHGVESVV